MSNQHNVYFKHLTVLFVAYTSIKIKRVDKSVEQWRLFRTADRSINWANHLENRRLVKMKTHLRSTGNSTAKQMS